MTVKINYILLFLLFTFLAVFFIYLQSFNSYFFQDDWYSISISKASGVNEFVNFFRPQGNVVYFRPLGMQVPFFILTSAFGINALPFRVLTFITHLFNIYLVFVLVKKILISDRLALLSSFFYGISSVHYIPFYWSSTYAFVLGPTFFFLTLINFIGFINNISVRKYMLAFIFFILGILTYETISVFSFLGFLYLVTFNKLKYFKYLIPFFLISALYLIFRAVFYPPPQISAYKIALGIETLHNLKYYFLWSMNWPEEIKYQFIKFFTVNPLFLKSFYGYYYVFVISLFINLIFLFLLPFIIIFGRKTGLNYKLLLFSFLWFFIGILPVIFFPNHSFAYYLPVSLVGFSLFFCSLFQPLLKYINPAFLIAFESILLLNWLISSYSVIQINKEIHWAPRRSLISREIINKAGKIDIQSNSSQIFLISPGDEYRLALNNQDALRIFFNNQEIKTLYTSENTKGVRL